MKEDKFYYKDGSVLNYYDSSKILHRTDGPAIEWAGGDKIWYIEGKRHRLDGPAVEYADGDKQWWVEGRCHRLDGPAVEWAGGAKHWYIEGKKLTYKEWLSESAYKEHKFTNEDIPVNDNCKHKCTCDMTTIMRHGCKCGGF